MRFGGDLVLGLEGQGSELGSENMSLSLVRPQATELKPRIVVFGVGGAGSVDPSMKVQTA